MKYLAPYLKLAVVFFIPLAFSANAQQSVVIEKQCHGLFDSDTILHLSISGAIKDLMRNRSDEPDYFPITLSYNSGDSTQTIPLKARTRGNFRRKMAGCTYPPILLNFQKKTTGGTIFHQQDKLKLTLPCKGDEYVIREYLVYKMYNLVSPLSYKARLVKIKFYDTSRNRENTELGLLIEEDDQMAERNKLKVFDELMVRAERTSTEDFLNVAVFNYMIGNTDWQTEFLHNIRLVAFDSINLLRAVPYDFDLAGLVSAPYAKPAIELELSSVKERRYRGYCMETMARFENVFAHFNKLKPDFYNLLRACKLLDDKYIQSTIEYLDDFYNTINNPKKAEQEFLYPCGRQKIIIKGLGN